MWAWASTPSEVAWPGADESSGAGGFEFKIKNPHTSKGLTAPAAVGVAPQQSCEPFK